MKNKLTGEQVQVVMLVLALGNGFTVVYKKYISLYIYIYLKNESSECISLGIMTLKGCFKRQFIFYFQFVLFFLVVGFFFLFLSETAPLLSCLVILK